MTQHFPDFFILGAAKAGTTSLYDLLNNHEQIAMSIVKEPMFFSRDDYYHRGLDWYSKTFFAPVPEQLLIGEATPHYLYWAEKVAPRILESAPQKPIKFIIILRDPVFRTYSWYWNMIKEGEENLSFEEALAEEKERLQTGEKLLRANGSMIYGYKKGSMFASQIKQFLKYFPRDHFYFLLQEDLQNKNSQRLNGLYEFLGISVAQTISNTARSNPSSMPRSKTLQGWFRNRSLIKELVKRLIPFRMRQAIKSFLIDKNSVPFVYPEIGKDTELKLRTYFAGEVLDLQTLAGRDLSNWLPGKGEQKPA
jgi:hypothetical protein